MTHYEARTHEREFASDLLTKAQLAGLCYEYECAAIIISRLVCEVGDSIGEYRNRSESNGDLVVLIIRDHKPITIMYRRSNQRMTAESMRVNELVDLTN